MDTEREVATVLTVYGIETFLSNIYCLNTIYTRCNSTYRLRY